MTKRDLTGQRFGRLIAVEPTDERVDGLVVWRCVCDCGNVALAVSSNLTRGRVRSCGCLASDARMRDLRCKRFGKLNVAERVGSSERGSATWLCRCDCGREVVLSTDDLRRGVDSCGCDRQPGSGSRPYELAGRRFGRLVALRPTGKRSNGYVVWECACDCGNTKEATSHNLVAGKTKSCGCLPRGRKAKRA